MASTHKRQSSNHVSELHNYDLIDGIIVRIGEQFKPPPRINIVPVQQQRSTTAAAEELLAFEYNFRVEKDFMSLYQAKWQTPQPVVKEQETLQKSSSSSDTKAPVVNDDDDDEALQQLKNWLDVSDTTVADSKKAALSSAADDETKPKRRLAAAAEDAVAVRMPHAHPFANSNTLLIPEKNPSPVYFSSLLNNQKADCYAGSSADRHPSSKENSPNQSRQQANNKRPTLQLEEFEPSEIPFDSVVLNTIDDKKELESILSSSSSSSAMLQHRSEADPK